jgi:sodium transport system permease protein
MTETTSARNDTPPLRRGAKAALGRVFRLTRKELSEILRDRRTIVTLVAMPLLLYPLMSVAFQQFFLANRTSESITPEYRIGFETKEALGLFEYHLELAKRAYAERSAKEPVKDAAPQPRVGGYLEPREKLDQLLRANEIDLRIEIGKLPTFQNGPHDFLAECDVHYLPGSATAREALAYLESRFAALNEKHLAARLNWKGAEPVALLTLKRLPGPAEPGAGRMVSLAALVPLILILMTITGAVYPAIDLTAGERERGTLEILVAAPVSRFELLTAKYFSVVAVAVLTALVNLVCMVLTLRFSGLGRALFGDEGLSPGMVAQVLALLLLFAAFFSAVLLSLTSFARSFKEAQAYLIPLMLASMTPGALAMMPGLKLQGLLAIVPLVNIVLLARDLFEHQVDPATATVAVLTTLMYALAALSLAARVFGAESVLYSEQSSWADLLRRPDEPQAEASIPSALWCLALMAPLHFALVAVLQSLGALDVVVGFALMLAVNALLFGAWPAFVAWLGRVDWRSGFGFNPPPLVSLLSAAILGASLWPLELGFLEWMRQGVDSSHEHLEAVAGQLRQTRERLGWGILLAVIVPAVLEEWFFRGLLFNALRKRCQAMVTIGVSALLFGLTHVVTHIALGPERFLPSTLLGVVLGWVCWRSGSVWPSTLMHVAHNTLLLVVGMSAAGQQSTVPPLWIAAGAAGAVVGAGLLFLAKPKLRAD